MFWENCYIIIFFNLHYINSFTLLTSPLNLVYIAEDLHQVLTSYHNYKSVVFYDRKVAGQDPLPIFARKKYFSNLYNYIEAQLGRKNKA